MELNRPNPDEILARIAVEEELHKRGRLTIYFGAAPGVGKTYSMAYDAQLQKREGKDIVVGYFEPHNRPETLAMLQKLEVIHPRVIRYRGINFSEADVDAIIRRKPTIVLLDEFAHSNAPGSRNKKRYQDVEELLNAGIDVWTTLNVQHLESVKDTIYDITHVRVRESVPDPLFHNAYEVNLIDCSVDTLMERLAQGKVYVKDMADIAVRNYFTRRNILALREITLRLVDNRLNHEVLRYREGYLDSPPKERVLAILGPHSDAEQVVRAAYQAASSANGELSSLYIDSGTVLTDEEKQWLNNAMETAKKFGAQFTVIKGENVAEDILSYARNHVITTIVVGSANRKLSTTLSRLVIASEQPMDLTVISGGKRTVPKLQHVHSKPIHIVLSILSVIAASLIGFFFQNRLGQTNILFLMLVPVIVSALYLGMIPSVFAALLSLLLFDYLFVPPYYKFAISDTRYFLTFCVYILIAAVISNLASKSRDRMKEMQQSESESAMLYDLSRDLVAAFDEDTVIDALIKHITAFFPCEMVLFLYQNSKLTFKKATRKFQLDARERSVAEWVLVNGKPAGRYTDTLHDARGFYVAMKISDRVIGVIGFAFPETEKLSLENKATLETIAQLGALALESIHRIAENAESIQK